jgi:membrane protein implicated in regulation of membrane protease activity
LTIPKLKESTTTALLALIALLLAPGLLILSPDGRLFFLALAGFISAIVAIFAPSGKKRLVATVALVIAVVTALQTWPEYRSHADTRLKRISQPAGQDR